MNSKDNVGRPNTDWYTRDTTANTFVISTAAELAGLAQIVNGIGVEAHDFHNQTITLDNDIDLSGYAAGEGWMPIGNYDDKTYRMFSGTFDGYGHIISNLTINRGQNINKKYQGLFGYVRQGWVGNLGLTNVDIIGGGAVGSVAGAISESIVTKIYSTGTVKGYNIDIGGVVGSVFRSSVTCSYSTCAVCGISANANNIGGIAGYLFYESGILSCAALNTKVMGQSGKKIGRVVGDVHDVRTVLLSNVAYIGMDTTANDTNVLLAAQNGVDITADQIRADGTINGYLRSENGWAIENGKLPGLGDRTVDLPEHLK